MLPPLFLLLFVSLRRGVVDRFYLLLMILVMEEDDDEEDGAAPLAAAPAAGTKNSSSSSLSLLWSSRASWWRRQRDHPLNAQRTCQRWRFRWNETMDDAVYERWLKGGASRGGHKYQGGPHGRTIISRRTPLAEDFISRRTPPAQPTFSSIYLVLVRISRRTPPAHDHARTDHVALMRWR